MNKNEAIEYMIEKIIEIEQIHAADYLSDSKQKNTAPDDILKAIREIEVNDEDK